MSGCFAGREQAKRRVRTRGSAQTNPVLGQLDEGEVCGKAHLTMGHIHHCLVSWMAPRSNGCPTGKAQHRNGSLGRACTEATVTVRSAISCSCARSCCVSACRAEMRAALRAAARSQTAHPHPVQSRLRGREAPEQVTPTDCPLISRPELMPRILTTATAMIVNSEETKGIDTLPTHRCCPILRKGKSITFHFEKPVRHFFFK